MIHVMSVNDLQYKILEFVVCGKTIICRYGYNSVVVVVSTCYKGCKIFHIGGRHNKDLSMISEINSVMLKRRYMFLSNQSRSVLWKSNQQGCQIQFIKNGQIFNCEELPNFVSIIGKKTRKVFCVTTLIDSKKNLGRCHTSSLFLCTCIFTRLFCLARHSYLLFSKVRK